MRHSHDTRGQWICDPLNNLFLILHHDFPLHILTSLSNGKCGLAYTAAYIYQQNGLICSLYLTQFVLEREQVVRKGCLGRASLHRIVEVLEAIWVLKEEVEHGQAFGVVGIRVGIVTPGVRVGISIFLEEFGHFHARKASLVVPEES